MGENTRGQDINYYKLSAARQKALQAKVKGVDRTPERMAFITETLSPSMNPAVKFAENDPGKFGVRSIKGKDNNKILNESIENNFIRWDRVGRPGTFVDFMRDRWAPIGAANDPKNLNANWNNNVRAYLLRTLGPKKYGEWERLNLVQNLIGGQYAV